MLSHKKIPFETKDTMHGRPRPSTGGAQDFIDSNTPLNTKKRHHNGNNRRSLFHRAASAKATLSKNGAATARDTTVTKINTRTLEDKSVSIDLS